MSRATTATGCSSISSTSSTSTGRSAIPTSSCSRSRRAKADRAAAEHLGLAAGDGVFRIRNRLSLAGTPVIIDDITLPVAVFPGLTERQFRHRTVDDLQPLPGSVRHLGRAGERAAARDARRRRDRRAAVDRARRAAAADPPRSRCPTTRRRSSFASRSSTPRATNTSPTSASLRSAVLRLLLRAARQRSRRRVGAVPRRGGAHADLRRHAGRQLRARLALHAGRVHRVFARLAVLPRDPLGFWTGVLARGARRRAHRRGDRGAAS